VTRILVLIGVALLASSCGHSRSVHPKPSAVIVLQYTPSYLLLPAQPAPAPETRRLVCIAPLTPLCSAATTSLDTERATAPARARSGNRRR
jgi:hypothetical protein